MKYLIVTLIFLGLPYSSHAGIETELLATKYGDCSVRITHDATPSSENGTIILRAYKVVAGIHHPCPLSQEDTTHSLSKALKRFLKHSELKPISSIMLGRLIRYPWITKDLAAKSNSPRVKRLSHPEFNRFITKSEFIAPFATALTKHGFTITGASCEKLMFYHNGSPKDAMCWLIIKKVNP